MSLACNFHQGCAFIVIRPMRGDGLKKIYIIAVCLILLSCSMAAADEVDDGLPQITTEQVRASARSMIKMGMDSKETIEMTRLMLQGKFAEEQVLRAHQVLKNTREQGLPQEPVMIKVREGITKQVPVENIIQAMEHVRSRYNQAYAKAGLITQKRSQVRVLGNIIAECMVAGVAMEDIERIMRHLQDRAGLMNREQALKLSEETLKTARDIARLGLGSRKTTDLLVLALKNQYTAQQMKSMRNTFLSGSKTNSPSRMASDFTRSFAGGQDSQSGSGKGTGPAGGTGSPGSGAGGGNSNGGSNGSGGPGSGGSGSNKGN